MCLGVRQAPADPAQKYKGPRIIRATEGKRKLQTPVEWHQDTTTPGAPSHCSPASHRGHQWHKRRTRHSTAMHRTTPCGTHTCGLAPPCTVPASPRAAPSAQRCKRGWRQWSLAKEPPFREKTVCAILTIDTRAAHNRIMFSHAAVRHADPRCGAEGTTKHQHYPASSSPSPLASTGRLRLLFATSLLPSRCVCWLFTSGTDAWQCSTRSCMAEP
jgi:hypothetical protein